MRLRARQRFRLDRAGLEQVCLAWWGSEHPAGPPWPSLPAPTTAQVVEQVKALLKHQQAQTPGDLAALVAAEGQTLASSERARKNRARLALLPTFTTGRLLRLLSFARGNEFVMDIDGDEVAGRVEGHEQWWSVGELKGVLATRAHVPRVKEAKARRQARAKAARNGRSRPPQR
jgi:hypothetical protein